tara:strand:+ start:82 stop:903 length:822 start_codon:yes stop_codon:yes gene_type:complete
MSSGTRNRAASRIQSAARRSRITRSLTGQLNDFFLYLSESPNVIDVKILNVNPDNTITLMVDTRTQGGATKRTLLCIDVGADGKIRDINADCIKDAMPSGGLAYTTGLGSEYTEMGPNTYGPSLLGSLNHNQLYSAQQQLRAPSTIRTGLSVTNPVARSSRKAPRGSGRVTIIRYPLVSQLGLSPQEILDMLEGGNYCKYPVFKRICKKLRKKIKDGETYKPSPQELEAIQEVVFSGSDVINVRNAETSITDMYDPYTIPTRMSQTRIPRPRP